MVDKISKERRSENMRRIKSADTKPEMIVRSIAHRLGYRFRLHRKDLPGKPDMVFPSRNSVIFVHGCFWHQHPDKQCADSRLPLSNTGYWNEKLRKNLERDQKNLEELERKGFSVLILWECEVNNTESVESKIKHFLE